MSVNTRINVLLLAIVCTNTLFYGLLSNHTLG